MNLNQPLENGKHQNNMFKRIDFWIKTPFGQITLYKALEATRTGFEYIPAKWYNAGEAKYGSIQAFKVSNYANTGDRDEYQVYLTYTDNWGNWNAWKWSGTYQEYLDYTTENARAWNIHYEVGVKSE